MRRVAACRPISASAMGRWCGALPPPPSYATATARRDSDARCPQSGVEHDDPQNWRLEVPQPCIDLYLDVSNTPRALSADEPQMLVQLVDAWRGLEHRKHIALE